MVFVAYSHVDPVPSLLSAEAFVPFSLSLLGKEPTGVVHVAAHGEAHSTDFTATKGTYFEAMLGAKWASAHVVMSMEDVPYVVSAAIGWLLTAQKQFRANGGLLVLHSVQPNVLNILKLLKVERVVPIAADEKAGVALQREALAAGQAA
jgi:anti-anti-sigma factor